MWKCNQISCNLLNNNEKNINLITVLGHTAGGKTAFAAQLAHRLNGEIISADSRQVYRNMDIGTGKDYDDYEIEGTKIPYHLIDIVDPGYEYNVYEYQKDFIEVFNKICKNGRTPVLCGGSGLYLEAILKAYRLINVPVNQKLREDLSKKSMDELEAILKSFTNPHNTTDTLVRKRMMRAIEIETYYKEKTPENDFPEINALNFGIVFSRDARRERITERLKKRLDSGMIEEAESIMNSGISSDKMEYYGLEYKFLSRYLSGVINREELFTQLNIAIHQFAKRQMTWFRKMEKNGIKIHWIEGHLDMHQKLEKAMDILQNYTLQLTA